MYELDEGIFIEENIIYPFFNDICANEICRAIDYIKSSGIPSVMELVNETEFIIRDLVRINNNRLKSDIYGETQFLDYYNGYFFQINPDVRTCYPRNRQYLTLSAYREFLIWHRRYSFISFDLREKGYDGRYANFLEYCVFLDLYRDCDFEDF